MVKIPGFMSITRITPFLPRRTRILLVDWGLVPGVAAIVVAIVAAAGHLIPKTSSRAITSPAGTADTMEVMAPVALDAAALRRVVEAEGGCLAWGGGLALSPADDHFIRVERPLDFDSTGQLVASVLSKKAAAGATHVLIDMPVGPTAKVRSAGAAEALGTRLSSVGKDIGKMSKIVSSDTILTFLGTLAAVLAVVISQQWLSDQRDDITVLMD